MSKKKNIKFKVVEREYNNYSFYVSIIIRIFFFFFKKKN